MSHGHVTPNENGLKARCGGPGICEVCNKEAIAAGLVVKKKTHLTDVTEELKEQLLENYRLRREIGERWEPMVKKLNGELESAKYQRDKLVEENRTQRFEITRLGNEVEELMKIDYWQDRHNIVKKELEELRDAKKAADKFIAWPLPETVCADLSATMPRTPHRSGTNLLSWDEAHQMFEYIFGKK
jgi:hypothetical protein